MLAFHSRHAPAWSTPELLDLLSIWGEGAVQSQLFTNCRNFDAYGLLPSGMQEQGHKRDMQQCHAKIKELKPACQKAREAKHHSDAATKTCCFYKELHAILSDDSTSAAKSPVDAPGRLEAVASRLNPGEEVVDKEVDMEDDVEHMAGPSGGTASQDLFSTLEGSSQS
ncbi:hypothetical protein UY3_02876 [Chelonia mydas]|uniref:Myb/SANT-like DNA-binding domain-containing protein n=1 Tax=Chelonia mydas TaxID=8469 RepID=M7BRS9_CHEMY|nr:hypothetical protein UY3_02876 [Chelonia mydas]